jgi:ligand-binding sensor protein
MIAVVRMAKSDGIFSIMAICAATFIGTLLPGLAVKKSEKEKLYIFDITADTMNSGKEFADILRSSNIAIKTSVVYDTLMIKTLSIKAYCANKEESKMVNEVLSPAFKYNVYSPMSLD